MPSEPSHPSSSDAEAPKGATPQTAGELAALTAIPEFRRLLERYQERTGIKLQIFNLQGIPLTDVETPPRYCAFLQEHRDCPLYFQQGYLRADAEGIKPCVASVGHLVAPILDKRGQQVATVVSQALRFGRNPIEPLSQKAFQHKIFPDDFINAANAIKEAPSQGPHLLIGELLSMGLELLSQAQTKERVTAALASLQEKVVQADVNMLCQHLVEAALALTGGDYGLVVVFDDQGEELSTGYDQPNPDHLVESKRRLLEGVAEWVRHADRHVTVPDVATSAWCRYLTGEAIDGGSIVGVPLAAGGKNIGAVVVAFDNPRAELETAVQSLQEFVVQGAYAVVMGRKLLQSEQAVMLDPETGVFNARYLDDLLEREISRASRAGGDVSVVLFQLEGLAEISTRLGGDIAARLLREAAALIRSKTRRVNTLARLGPQEFCLVVPEAGRPVAARLAESLRRVLQDHPFSTPGGDEILRLQADVGFATSELGKENKVTLLEKARAGVAQARTERRAAALRR
jgi:diguanylate cyclase (GGDEF)-like protein